MSDRVQHILRWDVWVRQTNISVPTVAIRGHDLGRIISFPCCKTQSAKSHGRDRLSLLSWVVQMNQVVLLLDWEDRALREYERNFCGAKKMPFFSPDYFGWWMKKTELPLWDSDPTLYSTEYKKSRWYSMHFVIRRPFLDNPYKYV